MKRAKIVVPILLLLILGISAKYILSRQTFIYAGTVETTKVDISARISSVVAKILVKEGNEVNNGDLLLSMSCEDIKISEALTKSDYKRSVTLIGQGSIPRETFEHAKFKYDEAKLKLEWCEVKSPLKGTILNRYREPGELISAGTKLFTLANLDDVYAYIYVEEAIVSKLLLNQKMTAVTPEMAMKEIEGVISKINEQAEFTPKNVQTRQERTRLIYGVKISFNNSNRILKPGMTVEIKIPE